MNKTTYEQYLLEHGKFTYVVKGVSMLPFIKQGRDLFTVKAKTEERCKKYDVVLYKRGPGVYVLHRVVKVRPDDYVILGDNCVYKEYGIKDEDIIGIMTSFTRKGHEISVDNKGYQVLSRLWYYIHPIRSLLKILRGKVGRLLRKLKLRK